MNTKSIAPETVIAGFVLLLVIILFILLQMSDEELNNIFKNIYSISGGASAILVIIVFGLSVTLGSLSHRIGRDLSTLYYKVRRKNIPKQNPSSDINYNNWLAKSFYRTLMLAGPAILTEVIFLDYRLSSGRYLTTILIIGIILEIVFIISFITQRKDSLNNG